MVLFIPSPEHFTFLFRYAVLSRQRCKCHLFFPSPEHFTFLRYKVLSAGRRFIHYLISDEQKGSPPSPQLNSFLYQTSVGFYNIALWDTQRISSARMKISCIGEKEYICVWPLTFWSVQ